jgi:hypothetical protein
MYQVEALSIGEGVEILDVTLTSEKRFGVDSLCQFP